MKTSSLLIGATALLGASAIASTTQAAPTLRLRVDDSSLCVRVAAPPQTVTVFLEMADLGLFEAAGFQAYLEFDPTKLDLVSGVYTDNPFGLPLISPIVESAPGQIDLAAGINLFIGQMETSDDAVLAVLTFSAIAEDCDTNVRFRDGIQPSQIVDINNVPLAAPALDLLDSQQITIDSTPPKIQTCCPSVTRDANASCQAQVPDMTTGANKCAFATDNCTSGADLVHTQNPPMGTPIGLGTTFVTITVTDCSGNTDECQVAVNVVDNTNPTIVSCPEPIIAEADINCATTIPDLCALPSLAATDNCDNLLDCTQSPLPGTIISGKGIHTVSLTVTDNAGNTDSCAVDITIVDNTSPKIATCQSDVTLTADASCNAIIPNMTSNVIATDNCTPGLLLDITQSPVAGTVVSLGAHPVLITVMDAHGNIDTCTATVTVQDTTAPAIITCAPAQVLSVNAGCQALMPDLAAMVTATDNCSTPLNLTITQSKISGSELLGVGTIIVQITVTDESGNSTSCDVSVTTIDEIPPTIVACSNNVTVSADANCQAAIPNFASALTASDNCTLLANLSVTQSPALGTLVGLGDHTVTLTVTDEANLIATCTATLTVNDTTSPSIICPANLTVECESNDGATLGMADFDFIVSDNCDLNPTIVCAFTNADIDAGNILTLPMLFPKGKTFLVCAAEDFSGNADVCTFTVNVVDSNAPTVLVNGPAADVEAGSDCVGLTPDVTGLVSVSDGCDNAVLVTQRPEAGSLLGGAGNYSITIVATDKEGNINDSIKIPVSVVDVDGPTFVTCATDVKVSADSRCQALAPNMLLGVVATDNCTGGPFFPANVITLAQDPPAGAILDLGVHTVTVTATDHFGNATTCSAIIDVVDKTPPFIQVCSSDVTLAADPLTCLVAVPDFTDVLAGDNCTSSLNLVVTQDPAAGTMLSLGTYLIVITATDEASNSVNCFANLSVIDDTPPTISGLLDIKVDAMADVCHSTVVSGKPDIFDACDLSPNVQSLRSDGLPLAAPFNLGVTTVTWTATDASGNQSQHVQTVEVNDNLDPTFECPDSIVVFAEAGTCQAFVDLGTPFVKDNCDGNPFVVATRNDGQPLDAPYLTAPGTETVTTVIWRATDNFGNFTECTQKVSVKGFNELVLDLELSPTVVTGQLTRCITFDLFVCGGNTTTVNADITFTNGLANNARVEIPCGTLWQCITARDAQHTLRRNDIDNFGVSLDGKVFVADFTGNDALIGGNLNDDDVIDIIDFAIFAGQFLESLLTGDTPCGSDANADVSGNGLVFIEDFSFIAGNFRSFADANCCTPLAAAQPEAVMSISVDQLLASGQADLAVADLTGDGWVDEADIIAFINGDRPTDVQDDSRYVGKDNGSWFDSVNWTEGNMPNADKNVVIAAAVLVDQFGAEAKNVTVALGGNLIVARGSLTADSLTVQAGATLTLNDPNATLILNALYLEEGATLNWISGVIELAGNYIQAASDLIIGASADLSSLRLIDGATATITGDTFIGYGHHNLGELAVDGEGTVFTTTNSLFVGYEGFGTLLVTNGGRIVATDIVISELGIARGDGILEGDILNAGTLFGAATILGSYTQTETGVIEIELGREAMVSDLATLAGTLRVDMSPDMIVEAGDRFTLLAAAVIAGSFDSVELPELAEGLAFHVSYEFDQVVLEVIAVKVNRDQPVELTPAVPTTPAGKVNTKANTRR